MAGRSWKDLKPRTPSASTAPQPPQLNQGQVLEQAGRDSPQLGRLLDQRKALESRINSLVSGEENMDPRDAARFNVPTFAQRQAQQREWEHQREINQQRNMAALRQGRAEERRIPSPTSEVGQWVAQRDAQQPQDGVSRWLAQRDQGRQALRDQARDRLAPLDRVADVGRQLRQPMSNMSSQLDQMDQRLAQEGVSDSERDEIRRALAADKLKETNKQLEKYSKMVEAPKRAVEKIDQKWQGRQQQISGAMDRFGPYVERSRRRLSTETGGSGDLFERMARNREQALTRRQERREQEQRDEARRERALRRRRDRDETRW